MTNYLKVMLWGSEIGRLAWHESRKLAYFTYNPEFLRGSLDVAPIVASIHSPMSTRAIFGESERIYQKLPSFIADSLPDAWGNQLFEQWRKQNHLSLSSLTPLQKLAFIGKRGMGALEYEPEIARPNATGVVDIEALAALAKKIYSDRENVTIGPDEQLTLHSLIAVGTSAGGRQPKAIIAINTLTGEIRSGQVETKPDYEHYILKFGDSNRSSAELEMAYHEMALAAGITMTESRLMQVEGVSHFLTKRFDRSPDGKLHTQTLAALCPEAANYEQLLAVCRKLHLPESDCREVFSRLVFNILANNTDDHNKNFSFVMNRSGQWRLSPAYDVTFIFDGGGFLPCREHCMMAAGKLHDFTLDDILALAAECGISRPEAAIRQVADAIATFRTLAEKHGVREQWIGRVEHCLNAHLAAWNLAPKNGDFSFTLQGHNVANARIETAYKGNFHLLACIDGQEMKYIIRTGKPEHDALASKGISRLTASDMKALVEQHLLPKIKTSN